MPNDALPQQLQSSLGAGYTIDRELGGGGMSRVFVAQDHALERLVAVKVLSPELAEGLSGERFLREIRLAASLQQANIVPVLWTGNVGALPYYAMPYVEGESLRQRLLTGALPISEVTSVLRDVARALGYAHSRGVVHRDIKPDNVLVSGGAAVVTDFGLAKAISAARSEVASATLTQMGMSIGTPSYMAPEQAAGDPDVDHRADLYSLGCLAFELLTGRMVFTDRTPQRILAAHMAEAPPLIGKLRRDCPPPLAQLVMQLLRKDPGERPQSATDVIAQLDAVSTSGSTSAMPSALVAGPRRLWVMLAAYAAVFAGVVLVAKAAVVVIGLPDWVVTGAIIVMSLGLPALLATAYVQRVTHRIVTATPTLTPGGTMSHKPQGTMATMAVKVSPHVSWRRTIRGGYYALGGFAVLVAVVMVLRAFGIGPAASLFAAGTLKANDPLLVAEFGSSGADSTIGRTLSDAVRADLGQSGDIAVLGDREELAALARMQRASGTRVLLPVARELAQREGIRAIVDGDVKPIGTGYLVTLRLVTTDSLQELARYHGGANSPAELIATLGTLTRQLRGKIGESLRKVQGSPRLEEASTASLPALQKFSEARRALFIDGDGTHFVSAMRQAIALDSTFASAYVALSTELGNRGGAEDEVSRLAARAYALRDRVPEFERLRIEQNYFQSGPVEVRSLVRERQAILARLALRPDNYSALDHLALNEEWSGNHRAGDSLHRLAIAHAGEFASYPVSNLVKTLLNNERLTAAESLIAAPANRKILAGYTLRTLVARGFADSAVTLAKAEMDTTHEAFNRAYLATFLRALESERGKLRDADRMGALVVKAASDRGATGAAELNAIARARRIALILGDREGATRLLDSLVASGVVARTPFLDRPYAPLVMAYANSGRPDRARSFLAELEKQSAGDRDARIGWRLRLARADVAIAERRWDDAVREVSTVAGMCIHCFTVRRAAAYDGKQNADSALALYEKFAKSAQREPVQSAEMDEFAFTLAWRRIGELYEARGDIPSALQAYERFVSLWKAADPELQPQVRDVRGRIARLQAASARKR